MTRYINEAGTVVTFTDDLGSVNPDRHIFLSSELPTFKAAGYEEIDGERAIPTQAYELPKAQPFPEPTLDPVSE